MTAHAPQSYEAWLAELARIAAERNLEWLVATDSDIHRPAYDRGASPEQELSELEDMSEWRGCGCGGGG